MPTYEYVCTDCGAPLEVVQSIHEPSLTECPACQGRLRKVFGNVGVVFKGSGFYRTDSRGKAGKTSATSPAAPKADSTSDGKSASTSDSKPAANAPAKPADSASSSPASGPKTSSAASAAS
jgi:putative FmdB family regulatory protein